MSHHLSDFLLRLASEPGLRDRLRTRGFPVAGRPLGGPGSLIVVGSGIALMSQITPEAVSAIRHADVVLHVVRDQVTARWLGSLNANSRTMLDCYEPGGPRRSAYREMADRIVAAVRSGLNVCAVFYGHPGVLVDASRQAMNRVRRAGYPATMLPGISTEACMYADLDIDPGHGCQTYEVTRFLAFRRRIDPTSALILWQVGLIGEPNEMPMSSAARPDRLRVLARRLLRSYPAQHPVVIYRASTVPTTGATVRRVRLDRLARAAINPAETLYLPPLANRRADPRIVRWMKIHSRS